MARLNMPLPLPFRSDRNLLLPGTGKFPATQPKLGVLVVDDDDLVRSLLDATLSRYGFAVWVAANAQQALEMYRVHLSSIDVVLLDVQIPGIGGPEILIMLQDMNPQVRCGFMSGDLGAWTGEELQELGGEVLFRKPFQLKAVSESLYRMACSARGTV
jgi:CheY-like chemotaxis protein